MGDSVYFSTDFGEICRGERAEPTPELGDFLCSRYGFDRESPFTDLGGSCSLNLSVTKGGKPFVVRVHLPCVSKERLEGIHRVKDKLNGAIPCAEALATLDGFPYTQWDGRLIEAEPYVTHDAFMKTPERLEKGMALLGKIHSLLEGLELPPKSLHQPFINHIPASKTLEMTMRGVSRIRSLPKITKEESRIASKAESLAKRLSSFEYSLPKQLTHGDFWDNNVYFNKGKIVLVNDFDFMSLRPRIEDVALTFYFTDAEFTLFQPDIGDHKKLLAALLRSYNSGLTAPLTKDERELLPLAMARQPLWCIGGWCVWAQDEGDVRRNISDMLYYINWAHSVLDELDQWRNAFKDA